MSLNRAAHLLSSPTGLEAAKDSYSQDSWIENENIKLISKHVPKHLKPASKDQFGYYLAGLIDVDGHFSSKQQLVIVFHSLDASLAYVRIHKRTYWFW